MSSWLIGLPNLARRAGSDGLGLARGSWSIMWRTIACITRTFMVARTPRSPGSRPRGHITSITICAVSRMRRCGSTWRNLV